MAYRPRTFTTNTTAREAINYDAHRTKIVISNLSGETVYMGVDNTVTATGVGRGSPIFNNGRFEADFSDGTDPRLARWLIGVAGGDVIIMEEVAEPPINKLEILLSDLINTIRRLVKS